MSVEWGEELQKFRKETKRTQGELSEAVSKLWLQLTEAEQERLQQIGVEFLDLSTPDISRYENARRMPRYRSRYVSLIFSLYKLNGLTSAEEANHWLQLADQGPLTSQERAAIFGRTDPPAVDSASVNSEPSPVPPPVPNHGIDAMQTSDSVTVRVDGSASGDTASSDTAPEDSASDNAPPSIKKRVQINWLLAALVGLSALIFVFVGRYVWNTTLTERDKPAVVTVLETDNAGDAATTIENAPSPLVVKAISLAPYWNDSIQNYIPDFEHSGLTTFNNVEFDFGEGKIVRTHCSIFPDDLREEISLDNLDIANPHQIFLLLNAAATDLANVSDKVGAIEIRFADGTQTRTDLTLGHNIREWRIDAANTITQISHPSLFHVYTGTSDRGDKAVLDMLTIEIGLTDRVKTLTAINIIDTSGANLGSPNPCLFVYGLAVKHRP